MSSTGRHGPLSSCTSHRHGESVNKRPDPPTASQPSQDWLSSLEELRKIVFHLSLQRLGDRDLAEDVAQEVLMRVLKRILEDPGEVRNLRAFLLGVARNVILDVYRSESRLIRLDPDRLADGAGEDLSVSPYSVSPYGADSTQSCLPVEVREGIDNLPEKERDVVQKFYFDEMTCVEIARQNHEPPPRIRKRKSRAIRRLRAEVYSWKRTHHPTQSIPH